MLDAKGKKIEIAGWAYKEGDKITNVGAFVFMDCTSLKGVSLTPAQREI